MGGADSKVLLRLNRPAGDNDLMLKRDDLTPSGDSGLGDDGLMDFLSVEGGGDVALRGGEIDRTGGAARIVGVGPERMDVRIVYWPLLLRDERFRCRSRWKLLTEASESLSYVGTGGTKALVFDGTPEALCGRGLAAAPAAAVGRCFFCRAPLGGLVSIGGMLCR